LLAGRGCCGWFGVRGWGWRDQGSGWAACAARFWGAWEDAVGLAWLGWGWRWDPRLAGAVGCRNGVWVESQGLGGAGTFGLGLSWSRWAAARGGGWRFGVRVFFAAGLLGLKLRGTGLGRDDLRRSGQILLAYGISVVRPGGGRLEPAVALGGAGCCSVLPSQMPGGELGRSARCLRVRRPAQLQTVPVCPASPCREPDPGGRPVRGSVGNVALSTRRPVCGQRHPCLGQFRRPGR